MNWLDSFFISQTEQQTLMVGTYNYTLVILSIALASTASFVALHFASMTKGMIKRHRHIAIITGAFIMAGGVWSMHFVGMLAYDMGGHVGYDITITVISLLPSIIASYITLKILSYPKLTLWQLLISSLSVGAGIGLMHYIGMEAMEMEAELRYVPSWFIASIFVAIVLAFIALSARYYLSQFSQNLSKNTVNAISAVIMGAAIAGMHYSGMTAARFITDTPNINHDIHGQSLNLSYIVAFITLIVSAFAANIASQLRYRQLLMDKTVSELRLKTTLETAVDGIITINEKGIIQAFNAAASTIFGWKDSEIIGQSFFTLVPNNAIEEYKHYLEAFQKTRQTTLTGQAREVFAKHKDGHNFPVRLGVGHIALQESGSLFVGFVTDITERWAIEEKLRKSEEQYSSLIKNIPGATFRCLLDENWTAILVSDGIFQLSGWKPSDFYQYRIHFSDLIHPDDVELTNQAVSNAIENKTNYTVEFRWKHKAGHYIWVLENGSISWEDNKPSWIDGLILDISDRIEMESALRQAKDKAELSAESKARFLANMSHEIRTPMNAIIGFSDILLESDLSNENKKHLQTISQSARSLLHLLNDILDSAKLEKNKLELDEHPFDLIKLIDTVISTLWLQAKNKGLSLDFVIPPDLPEQVMGDENRIRQVLLNIVGNAIKFTEKGGVTLTLSERPNNHIRFSVQDTGIGIDSETLNNIFEPFAQADSSMSRRFGGTGLGTTISKQLVELMNGQLNASSELGKGSLFYFELPLEKTTLSPKPLPTSLSINIPRKKVLIADDIEQNLTLLTLLLKRQDHEVFQAENGLEALNAFKEIKPDIILMDLQMPKMDGFTATKEIREYEKLHHLESTPIIALTASVLVEDRIEAHQAGMDGFSHKPIDLNLLTAEMARVLGLLIEPHSQIHTVSAEKVKALSHINIDKGISLWGDVAKYIEELERFLQNYAQLPAEFSDLLKSGDFQQLKNASHKLNGLCGNLGLEVIHQHISMIEKYVREQNMLACDLEISALEQAFADFSNEFHTLSTTHVLGEVDEMDIQLLNSSEALKIVDELIALTSLGELDESKLETLVKGLSVNLKMIADDVKDAMTDFDFASANRDLLLIRKQLMTREAP